MDSQKAPPMNMTDYNFSLKNLSNQNEILKEEPLS